MRLRRFLGARVEARFRAGGLVLAGLLVGSERCAQEGSSGRADYVIQARLDGETKELDGRLELRWINKSGESVRELLFHLYLNAYSNNRSTHLTESDGKLRGHKLEEGWSWSRVKAVRVEGALAGGPTDVFPSLRYRHPEGASEEDRTVFSVDLPEPLAPGEGVRVEIEWESQLPRVRRRTGYKDDFLLVAQWFPKLGVYEAGRGWNCHPFHRDTEFYSDYGTYDVTLDLPAEYEGKVGASGVKILEQVRNERLEVRFVAPSQRDQTLEDAFGKRPLVHDFTWTADTDTVVFRQQFRAREWAERYPEEVAKARELFGEEPKLRDVDVTVLIQPERAAQAERHYHATCAALFFYGLWFGEYPYEHITVVDPAFGAGAAGGMEYPTLFTCGTRLFTTSDMHAPEGVTVHECGHQFWYGLVGNNEFEAAWLDEGFNTYTDSEVLHRVYGLDRGTSDYARVPIDGVAVGSAPGGGALADALAARKARLPLPWLPDPKLEFLAESGPLDLWRDQPLFTFTAQWTDARRADRVGYLASPDTDPLETPAWLHADRTSYATNSYPRTGVALRTLQGLLGDGPFLRGMRHYAREFRYAHPYPADFYRS
ncbi:MAG: M1 family metallopeptidase, partial [Planctomycetota bacterium]